MKKNLRIGILGYGEVGKALCNVYKEKGFKPAVMDLDKHNKEFAELGVLNVCIPDSPKFVEIVTDVVREFLREDGVVIIHSTVAPGTTHKVEQKLIKRGLSNIAVGHSPIRGIHPNLEGGIKTFVKFVGADRSSSVSRICEHLSNNLGLRVEGFTPAETTELGKLLSTNYYALCIAFHGYAKEWCDKYKVNFDEAVTRFNKSYNEGYTKLGRKNAVRPVLYPPQDMGGKIGGHCMIPNVKSSARDREMKALWEFIKKFS